MLKKRFLWKWYHSMLRCCVWDAWGCDGRGRKSYCRGWGLVTIGGLNDTPFHEWRKEVRNLQLRLELVETTAVRPMAGCNFRWGKGRRLSIWWKEQLPKSRRTMDNGPVLSQDNAAKERRRSSEQGGVKGKPESRWHGAGNGKLRRFSREKC